MTKNEKRMILALAKNVVRLQTLTNHLVGRIPPEEATDYIETLEEINEEMSKFIGFAKEEWGPDE